MKTYEEMAANALERIEKHKTEQKKMRRTATKIAVPAAGLCLAAVLCVGIWHSGIFKKDTPIANAGINDLDGSFYSQDNTAENEEEKISEQEPLDTNSQIIKDDENLGNDLEIITEPDFEDQDLPDEEMLEPEKKELSTDSDKEPDLQPEADDNNEQNDPEIVIDKAIRVVPTNSYTELTFSEAQADADFGAYMPGTVPYGFAEESIYRYTTEYNNSLAGVWTKGYDELRWQVSFYTEQDANRLTGVNETENYDLSLYPIPRADSVPAELREIVDNPIFTVEELTLDAVYARAYKSGESGDSSGWRMAFSVKYDNIIVRISSKGVEPEWLYQQLKGF